MTDWKSYVVAAGVVSLLLVGCGPPTKHDILQKADQVETKQQLADTLGEPADRSKLGPVETWTYQASDGEVQFVITGDNVTMQMTTDKVEDSDVASGGKD